MKKTILIVTLAAFILASCGTSKNYQKSPCWKGAEPKYRTAKMRA